MRLQREVEKRFDLLYKTTWAPTDAGPFWNLVVPLFLGLLSREEVIGLCIEAMQSDPSNFLSAFVGTLVTTNFISRIGSRRSDVLWGIRPDRIRSGFVHMLDLPLDTLDTVLREGARRHGVEKLREVFARVGSASKDFDHERLETIVRSTVRGRREENHPYYIDSETIRIEIKKFLADKPQANRIAKDFAWMWSPQLLELLREHSEAHVAANASEFMALSAYSPDLAVSQARLLPEQALSALGPYLKSKKREDVAARKRILLALLPRQTADRKHDPDKTYLSYEYRLKLIREVREKAKAYRNPELAALKLRPDYPELTAKNLSEILTLGTVPSALAMMRTAKRIGVGNERARELVKKGRKTARINSVWGKLFAWKEFRFNRRHQVSPMTEKIVSCVSALSAMKRS